jgi:hypothetical protein
MIGFQGDDGSKKTDQVQISAMTPEEFRNLFTLTLEPDKYREEMIQEAQKY